MHKSRMEGFSDDVMSIILTIMVLDLKPPCEASFSALWDLWPHFFNYIVSYMYIGIYWNHHHHLFQITKKVNGKVLIANLNLLFWFSLIPFVTAWIGKTHFALRPVLAYGVILLMAEFSFEILTRQLIALHGHGSLLKKTIGVNIKSKISIFFYIISIFLVYFDPMVSFLIYCLTALFWIIPNKRIEANFKKPALLNKL